MSDTDSPRGSGPSMTEAEVAKVAKLARLSLSDEELGRFTHQLSDILGHAEDIDSLDLADVEPMARPIPLANVMRADDPGPTLDREEVLGSAPVVEDHQFRVPPSLGEES